MTTFIEYLQFPFFFRALIVGSIIGLLLSWMSGYVVLRQEVHFTHALANIGFLGIALAILFSLPITPVLIASCLAAAYLIGVIKERKLFKSDSLLAIFSQLGIALAIIVIAFFPGYRINVEQFLFGDILGISMDDLWVSIVMLFVATGILIFQHSTFLKISLSDTLSHTLVRRKRFWHGIFVILLATVIALAIKIIGVILVSAFTTLPSNTAKLFAKNLRQTFILSTIIGLFSIVSGLYLSVVFDVPSGPMIIVVLAMLWILGILKQRIQN